MCLGMKRARVLVVDDEADLLDIVGEYLAPLGYDVRAAASGGEALARFGSERFDVAVVDWSMPGLAGAELLGRVRATWPEASILVVTGHGSDVVAAETPVPILRKPFTLRALARHVQQLTIVGAC